MKHEVAIPINKEPGNKEAIYADLVIEKEAKGVILFAHGSGSSRFSRRNAFVAEVLQKKGFATLLLDLLTEEEDAIDQKTTQFRFDIDLLAERLIIATKWVQQYKETAGLSIGYFGASTGAAAALIAANELAANELAGQVKGVVSRGGRPDLANSALRSLQVPTLFIVGGKDFGVIELNDAAFQELSCRKKMEIVDGATHLFEEPGALEKVAELAGNWFLDHLK